jgi:hypothetical protein
MKLVPFDNDRHRGFVLPTFSMQAGLPGAVVDRLIRDGANVVVAETDTPDPDGRLVFLGWAGTLRGALVWCYVKSKLAPLRLDPALMNALGVDTTRRIDCMFTGNPLRAMGRRYGWSFNWLEAAGQDAVRSAS